MTPAHPDDDRRRYLPVALDLSDQPVLLIGGGKVATERLPGLLDCGAVVTIISPEATEPIRAAAASEQIVLHARGFQSGDTDGYFLVLVATDDAETNAAAYQEAAAAGRLVNVCDDPAHCNVIFASRIERGPLTVSIFTHGTSPALSKKVRRELEQRLGPEWAALAELMADIRPRVLSAEGLDQPARQRVFEAVLASEALERFRVGDADGARALAAAILRRHRV